MKRLHALVALLAVIAINSYSQTNYPKGKVVVERITSESLRNSGGENATRRVTVDLPPDYDKTSRKYPVIYFFHGFTWSDSLMIDSDHFDLLMDKPIATGRVRPVIVVLPNERNLYRVGRQVGRCKGPGNTNKKARSEIKCQRRLTKSSTL